MSSSSLSSALLSGARGSGPLPAHPTSARRLHSKWRPGPYSRSVVSDCSHARSYRICGRAKQPRSLPLHRLNLRHEPLPQLPLAPEPVPEMIAQAPPIPQAELLEPGLEFRAQFDVEHPLRRQRRPDPVRDPRSVPASASSARGARAARPPPPGSAPAPRSTPSSPHPSIGSTAEAASRGPAGPSSASVAVPSLHPLARRAGRTFGP